MSRFHVVQTSGTALAVGSVIGYLVTPSSGGAKLRRVTAGLTMAGTPVSQQCAIGIARITTAGVGTATAGSAIDQLDPNSVPPLCAWNLSYATTAPVIAADGFEIPFNSQSGADMPWESIEEYVAAKALGLAFVVRQQALPTGAAAVLDVTWEE